MRSRIASTTYGAGSNSGNSRKEPGGSAACLQTPPIPMRLTRSGSCRRTQVQMIAHCTTAQPVRMMVSAASAAWWSRYVHKLQGVQHHGACTVAVTANGRLLGTHAVPGAPFSHVSGCQKGNRCQFTHARKKVFTALQLYALWNDDDDAMGASCVACWV